MMDVMPLVNEKQFQMRVSPQFLESVDNWRRGQHDLPGRSEAIRRLVEIALAANAEPSERNSSPKTRRSRSRKRELGDGA